MVVFVDESGDLGKKGRYFVIAMLIPKNPKRIVNFMRKFCVKYGLKEVKGSKLSFPQKQEVFNRLNFAKDYAASYIVADKRNIDNKEILKDKNLCYNYLFNFLIRKTIKNAKEDIQIVLDNHSIKVKSAHSLADYIKIQAYTKWGYKHNLSISYTDSKESKAVQAIDVIANAIYAHFTLGESHFYRMIAIGEAIRFPFAKFGQPFPITLAPPQSGDKAAI